MANYKYKTSKYRLVIEKIECEKETDKSVWVRGWAFDGQGRFNKASRVSTYDQYFDTWEQAHSHLVERAADNLANAHNALQKAEGEFATLKALSNPEGK